MEIFEKIFLNQIQSLQEKAVSLESKHGSLFYSVQSTACAKMYINTELYEEKKHFFIVELYKSG